MADICVIINAGSGKRRGGALADELRGLFAQLFPGRTVLCVARRGAEIGPEAERAVREGFRTVVAGGGDGTINAVASRLLDTECRLGILPLGTFNYVARRLGIPVALEDAVRVLTEGHEQAIDVGEVNGHLFLNNASLGAYAAILGRREEIYRRWGRSRIAAHWSVLAALAESRASLALKVTIDGEVRRFRTPMAFVANNAYQLERLGLAGGKCIAARKLALYVAPDCGRAELLRMAVRLALRRLRPERDFELLCGSDILVETWRRHRTVTRDGERMRMAGPFRFRLRRDTLRALVPAGLSPGLTHDRILFSNGPGFWPS
jgi:diacylglycerol kinase family enzyme